MGMGGAVGVREGQELSLPLGSSVPDPLHVAPPTPPPPEAVALVQAVAEEFSADGVERAPEAVLQND